MSPSFSRLKILLCIKCAPFLFLRSPLVLTTVIQFFLDRTPRLTQYPHWFTDHCLIKSFLDWLRNKSPQTVWSYYIKELDVRFFSRQSFLPRSFAKKRISFLPRSYFSKGTFVPSSFLLRSFFDIVNSRKTIKTSKEK